jgi:parvulin-like peptidyl-prolyl isomerase
MKKLSALILIISLIASISCGGGDRDASDPQYHKQERAESATIAKIGESELKVFLLEDFDEMYATAFASAEEEYNAKKEYLDSMINMYVFVEAAYELGLQKDQEVIKLIKDSRPAFMRDELFKAKILPFIDVSRDEIETWYDNMDEEVKMSVIFLEDSTRADSIYNAIKNGADFAGMARKYSLDEASAVEGGDLGFRTWVSLSEEFQNNVFNLEPGETVLFSVPGGWDIATVTERREVERQPLEQIEDMLISRIQAEKKARVQNEFYDELFEEANVKINEETAEFIYDKAATLYPDVIGGVPFRKNTFNPEDLAEYERNMILATYNGGEVTLGEYLLQTARWNDNQRPPFNEIENLKKAIFNLKLMELLQQKAEDMELSESVDYKDAVRFYKDQIMAAKMKELIVEEKGFVSEDEVAEYYQAHADEYVVPKKLHVKEILIETETDAEKIHERLQNGADFDELAANTIRPTAQNSNGDLGFIAEYNFPTLFERANQLKAGQFSEPFPVGDNWSIVKLVAVRDQQVKLFDEVATQLKTELENKKKETALEEWMTENRDRFDIDVKYDLIWETIDKEEYE